MQKAQKTLFFAFFANFVQSASKNIEKTLFSHTFCGTSRNKFEERCFFAFLANFVQSVLKNRKKHCFLTLFVSLCTKFAKNEKKQRFLSTKCLEKREKTLFSHTFCATSCKKLKKRCFFAFFANFVQSAPNNVKKHCFLSLFVRSRAKSLKNAVFSHFLRTLYKVSRKT